MLLLGADSVATRQSLSALTMTVSALAAGALALERAHSVRESRARHAWKLLGAGCLSWAVGMAVTLATLDEDQDVTSPDWQDVAFLLSPVLFGAALLRLARPASRLAGQLRLLLDGLLVSTSVLLVSWVAVLRPIIDRGADDVTALVETLAYPVGDVVIVTLAAYAALRARAELGRVSPALACLVGGLVTFACADSVWAYLAIENRYRVGDTVDVLWPLAFCALAVAPVLARRTATVDGPPDAVPVGLLLPYVFVVAGVVTAAFVAQHAGGEDDIRAWLRTLLILLLAARQVLALAENRHLTRTLERRVEERTGELRRSRSRFRALVEHSSEVVSLVDAHGRLLYQSEPGERVFGRPTAELLGRSIGELLDARSQRTLTAALAEVSRTPYAETVVELRLRHGDGGWRQIESAITNLLHEPSVGALVLNSRDVSERRELEGQLVHQAFHDSLTGLANRALFHDRVGHALRRRADGDDPIAVLFLDLNGFKEVNDSLGHGGGDALLVLVAQRLWTCVSRSDTVARLGGDEFAVLLEGDGEAPAPVGLAHRIREALAEPFVIDGRELFVSGSMGIATSAGGVLDAGDLIHNADLAMYQAKANRDRPYVAYDPSMRDLLTDRLELESDLRRAVRDGGLYVHYQPTYTLEGGQLVGVEALLRWHHPVRGNVPPSVFVPVAEQSDLIHDVGRFVLTEAVRQAVEWHRLAPGRSPSVAVNISGRQLQRPAFVAEVRELVEASGLPPRLLTLELTESMLMDDADGSMQALALLKRVGVRLAIDDFGTGYSSLSYLHRFPVDILKIDRSFVERLSDEDAAESLVHSIVRLGQTLHLQTVAEGIEDTEQLERLRRLGCELAQGYYFGRPDSPDVITTLLTSTRIPAPRT